MTTTTFIEKRKKNGHEFLTEITVETTPGNLSELRMVRGRYWDYTGDHITACNNVKVTIKPIYAGQVSEGWTDTFTEVVTPTGKGVIVHFESGPEMMGFIPNTGKALIHGCWKKYGQYRGHAVGYFRANKLNVNTKSRVYHTCPAHLYDAAKGGTTFKAA